MKRQATTCNTHFHPAPFSRGLKTLKIWATYQFKKFEQDQLGKINTDSIEEMSK